MEYVMVPVPEDLVDDVDRFMTFVASRSAQTSDQEHLHLEAAAGAYRAAGPPARRLLVTVAKAVVDEMPISLAESAAAVGLSLHEAMGMVGEANTNFVLNAGGFALMMPIPNPAPLTEGCPTWAHSLLVMREDVAEALLNTAGSEQQ